MRKVVLFGVSSLALAHACSDKHFVLCGPKSGAETTAEGIDKIFDESLSPKSPAELATLLQEPIKTPG